MRTLLLFTLVLPGLLHGQLFDLGLRASGPPCDSTLVVDFTITDNGGMLYTYTADIDTGNVTVVALEWNLYNIGLSTGAGPSITEQYFLPGQYAACLTVEAIDAQSLACSSTACKLVTVYADSTCSDLLADFTITNIAGNTVTFDELASFTGPIASYAWSLGDGASVSGPSPTHTFAGPGPFEVCLTVTAAPPDDECAATRCKWLYLGPGNVPCSTLLQPGFLMVVVDNTVGVLDTSLTSGMNYTVDWDFGDGSTASGAVAYHGYMASGFYNVCQTITLWGPLNTDTCSAVTCQPVYVDVLDVTEHAAARGLQVWPVPAGDVLAVQGLGPGPRSLRLLDGQGRVVRLFSGVIDGESLDLGGIAPGLYLLQELGGARTIRVIRS
jgi:PKD repeat protein